MPRPWLSAGSWTGRWDPEGSRRVRRDRMARIARAFREIDATPGGGGGISARRPVHALIRPAQRHRRIARRADLRPRSSRVPFEKAPQPSSLGDFYCRGRRSRGDTDHNNGQHLNDLRSGGPMTQLTSFPPTRRLCRDASTNEPERRPCRVPLIWAEPVPETTNSH